MILCKCLLVGLLLMSLGIALAQHGTPKTGTNNFLTSLIAFAIQMLLLWGGGFFG